MEIEYREIKPSKFKPVYSATPDPPKKLFRPYLVIEGKPKYDDYLESWKL